MRVTVLVGVLALVVAACGEDAAPPPADIPDQGEPAAGTAVPLDVVMDDGRDDLPILTVTEATAAADGPVAVRGQLLVGSDGTVTMCDALTRSLPPQCVGPTITVPDLVVDDVEFAEGSGDVRWSARRVIVVGEKVGNELFLGIVA